MPGVEQPLAQARGSGRAPPSSTRRRSGSMRLHSRREAVVGEAELREQGDVLGPAVPAVAGSRRSTPCSPSPGVCSQRHQSLFDVAALDLVGGGGGPPAEPVGEGRRAAWGGTVPAGQYARMGPMSPGRRRRLCSCSTSSRSRSTSSAALSPDEERQRVFGGQVAGQALVAAARTVEPGRAVHSLHAYFLRPGDPHGADPLRGRPHPRRPLVHHPPRRRHPARQGDLQPAVAASRCPRTGLEHQAPMPDVPAPEDAARLHRRAWRPYAEALGAWFHRPRPIDMRHVDWNPPDRTRAAAAVPAGVAAGRRHAARRPRAARLRAHLRERHDAARHRAAAPRRQLGRRATCSWPASTTPCGSTGRSGPTSGCSTTRTRRRPRGGRGLGRGSIFTADGHLAVTVVQEGLIRMTRPATDADPDAEAIFHITTPAEWVEAQLHGRALLRRACTTEGFVHCSTGAQCRGLDRPPLRGPRTSSCSSACDPTRSPTRCGGRRAAPASASPRLPAPRWRTWPSTTAVDGSAGDRDAAGGRTAAQPASLARVQLRHPRRRPRARRPVLEEPLRTSPPPARVGRERGARSHSGRPPMLATTTSNGPPRRRARAVDAATRSATPLAAALAVVARRRRVDVDRDHRRGAEQAGDDRQHAAAAAHVEDPLAGRPRGPRAAATASRVDSCEPDPKARPGSSTTTRSSGRRPPRATHAGLERRSRRPARTGAAQVRQASR